MDFGQALHLLKHGERVRRAGWNGKGMYLYLFQFHNMRYTPVLGEEVKFEPCIVMFTAQGLHQPGWLASQPDMLANDWERVND